MRYYSYEDFRIDTRVLIQNVRNLEVHSIVGIARGGLTLAHGMAEGLDIREVQTLRTELYDKTNKRDSIQVFENCSFSPNTKVLVLDDIADSGETLQNIMELLEDKYPQVEFLSATLFYKKTSKYKPDFWVQEANEWIEFFWEKDFL